MAFRPDSWNYFSDRTGSARKSSDRAPFRPARRRLLVEQLESRFMLSSSPTSVPLQFIAVGPDSPQTSISSIASMPASHDDGLASLPPTGEDIRSTIVVYDPSSVTSSIQAGPSSIVPAGVNEWIGPPILGSTQEGRWQDSPLSSQAPNSIGVPQESNLQLAGGFGAIGLDQARYDRTLYLQTGVSPLGPTSEISQNEPPLLAFQSSDGPLGSRIILDGSIAFPRPLIFSQFPGETATDAFPFAGRNSGEPGPEPFFASEGSVDSGGAEYSQPGGASYSQSGGAAYSQTGVLGPNAMPPPAMFTVARGAPPMLGHLLITKSSTGSGSSSTTESGIAAVSVSNSSAPINSLVQRQDDAEAAASGATPAQGLLAGGIVPLHSTRSGLGRQVSTAPPKETSIQPPRLNRSPVPTRSRPCPWRRLPPPRPRRARATALTSEFPPGRLHLEMLVRSAPSSRPSAVIRRLKSSATDAPCIRKSTVERALPDPPMICGNTQSGRPARPKKHRAALSTVRADFRLARARLQETAVPIWAVWSRRSDWAQPTFAPGPLKALTSLIAPRRALSRLRPKSEMTRPGTPYFSRRRAASRSVWPCPRAPSSPAFCSERRIASGKDCAARERKPAVVEKNAGSPASAAAFPRSPYARSSRIHPVKVTHCPSGQSQPSAETIGLAR